MRGPIWRSSSSPWWWPSASLTSLNRSRSSSITTGRVPSRRAATSARSTRSVNSARFGRPVRTSCSASAREDARPARKPATRQQQQPERRARTRSMSRSCPRPGRQDAGRRASRSTDVRCLVCPELGMTFGPTSTASGGPPRRSRRGSTSTRAEATATWSHTSAGGQLELVLDEADDALGGDEQAQRGQRAAQIGRPALRGARRTRCRPRAARARCRCARASG